MPFGKKVKADALVRSQRRCCVCHIFAGRYAEVHHIVQEADGGPSTMENAIVLCHRCHGEAGHYSDKHNIGNKYRPEELIKHRDLWWEWCSRNAGFSNPEDPVGISPTTIRLGGADGVTFGKFAVYNQTQKPCWGVWIKMISDSSAVDLKELEVGFLERSPHPPTIGRVGDLQGDIDLVTEDEQGKKVRFLSIQQMRPSEYVYFYVRIPGTPRGMDEFRLCLDLFDVGAEQLRLIWKNGEPKMEVQFPITLPKERECSIRVLGSYPVVDS